MSSILRALEEVKRAVSELQQAFANLKQKRQFQGDQFTFTNIHKPTDVEPGSTCLFAKENEVYVQRTDESVKLATMADLGSLIHRNGANAMTGNLNLGGNYARNTQGVFLTPTTTPSKPLSDQQLLYAGPENELLVMNRLGESKRIAFENDNVDINNIRFQTPNTHVQKSQLAIISQPTTFTNGSTIAVFDTEPSVASLCLRMYADVKTAGANDAITFSFLCNDMVIFETKLDVADETPITCKTRIITHTLEKDKLHIWHHAGFIRERHEINLVPNAISKKFSIQAKWSNPDTVLSVVQVFCDEM